MSAVRRLPPGIGVSSVAWDEWYLAQALDRAARFGELVEIYSGGQHSLISETNRAAAMASGLHFTVHGPYDGLEIGAPKERERRAAVQAHRRHLEAAAEIGAVSYVVHPDVAARPYKKGRDDRVLAALRASFADLEELQRATGVRVVVENMPTAERSHLTGRGQLSCSTPAAGDLDLGGLGFVLDTGHAAGCGTLDEFLADPPRGFAHVHLHDNPGPAGAGDPHLALGEGVVDVGAVLRVARQHDATVILEMPEERRLAASVEYLYANGLIDGFGAGDGR